MSLCDVFPALPGCNNDDDRPARPGDDDGNDRPGRGPADPPSVTVGPPIQPTVTQRSSSTTSVAVSTRATSTSSVETEDSSTSSSVRGSSISTEVETSTSRIFSTRSLPSLTSSSGSPLPESNANAAANNDSTSNSGLSVGAIIGIAVGGVAALIFLAWVIMFVCKKSRRRRDEEDAINDWSEYNALTVASTDNSPAMGNAHSGSDVSHSSYERHYGDVKPMSQASYGPGPPSLAQFAPPPPPLPMNAAFRGPMDRNAAPVSRYPIPNPSTAGVSVHSSAPAPSSIVYQAPHVRKKSDEYGFVNGMIS